MFIDYNLSSHTHFTDSPNLKNTPTCTARILPPLAISTPLALFLVFCHHYKQMFRKEWVNYIYIFIYLCIHSNNRQRGFMTCSVETAASQIVGYDHICDSIKHKLNVVGICGASLMAVNFLHGAFVLCFKLCLDVC